MNMESLTQKSQEALAGAQRIAQQHGHTETDGEHLLAALLEQEGASFRGYSLACRWTWMS